MSSKKIFIQTGIALAVASAAQIGFAQEVPKTAPNTPSPAAEPKASGSIAGDSQTPILETVKVTARRRVENAQDVPASISAVSGDDLAAKQLYQVQDLQQTFPNVSSQFLHARQSSLAIRGIGNNIANEGLEGSVGLYIDNVFLGRPGQAAFDLLDLEQVELLRGAQGTLFGKNTTAGVLNITTKKPTFEKSGSAEISGGSRNYQQYKATLNAPFSDTVATRISAYKTHDDGWVKNQYDGRDLNGIDRAGVKAQALIKPDENTEFRLIAEHHEEHSSTANLVPYYYGNKGKSESAPTTYKDTLTALGRAADIVNDPTSYDTHLNADQSVKTSQNAFSAEGNYTFKSGYKLTSITAGREWTFRPKNDLDFSALDGVTGGFNVKESQFSQELRLASPTGKRLDYVVGAYYYRQNIRNENRYDFGPAAYQTSGYPNNNSSSGTGEAKTQSYALFGQSTLHATNRFDLTGGLRLNHEEKKARVIQNAPTVALTGAFAPFDAVLGAYDSGNLQRKETSLSGLLNASYKLSEHALGYASYSRGVKSGGWNLNPVGTLAKTFGSTDAITLAPEKVNNFELGFKSTLLNRRLELNTSLFLTKVKGYQAITSWYNPNTANYQSRFTNVGDLTSKGVELELKSAVSRHLDVTFNAAYTNATFDSGTSATPYEVFNAGAWGGGAQDLTGKRVNGAPKWIANLGGQYRWSYAGGTKQYLNVNYAYRSSTFGDINNSIGSKIAAYGLFNANIGWQIPLGNTTNLDINLWVKNALDKHYFYGLGAGPANTYVASAGAPRTVGLTAKLDF